jgi:transposase
MKVSQYGTLRTFKVSSSSVAKTIKRYDETGSHEDRHRNGRPRVTSAAENKFISVTSLRNCNPNKCFTEFK